MFSTESLRDKALLALEEAVQETRYHVPRRSLALRFALAYLFASAPRHSDRQSFDRFWKALFAEKSPWSFSGADAALNGIYQAIGVERDDEISWVLWRRLAKEMGLASRPEGQDYPPAS